MISVKRCVSIRQISLTKKIYMMQTIYGDVMLQKSYTADYFTGKPAKNNGEYEAFVITDHHDAIIPKSSVQK